MRDVASSWKIVWNYAERNMIKKTLETTEAPEPNQMALNRILAVLLLASSGHWRRVCELQIRRTRR